jgi:hypothetical protein
MNFGARTGVNATILGDLYCANDSSPGMVRDGVAMTGLPFFPSCDQRPPRAEHPLLLSLLDTERY